ncbi:MAG: class I SAM-dependent methyltransferase [Candidatus Thorarchaeota archaeon]
MPHLSSEDEDPYEHLGPGYEGVGEFYDLFADNSDLPLYFKYAERCGSPILDIAAGTGRVTFALAAQGFDVVSLEQSPTMLAAAKARLDKSSPDVASRVTLLAGSMIEFSLDREFPLILIPTSFGHALTREDQLSTLKCVHDHLNDDGLFVVDIFPGEMQYEHATFEDDSKQIDSGRTVSRSGTIQSDPGKKLMRMDLQYTVRDARGEILKQVEVVSGAALIFESDIDHLVQESGFEVVEEFGDFENNPYTSESGRRILVLRKGD